MTTAYPLQWPAGKPRTRTPQPSRFGSHSTFSVSTTTSKLMAELRRLGAKNIVLSTNLELRLHGLPYSNRRAPADAGVAVYFTLKGEARCFACDRWQKVEENIVALAHTIDALRGIERWGGGNMVDQAFAGFAALPAPSAAKHWSEVIGVQRGADLDDVRTAYRRKAMAAHPDRGGDASVMAELNAAWTEFQKERGVSWPGL